MARAKQLLAGHVYGLAEQYADKMRAEGKPPDMTYHLKGQEHGGSGDGFERWNDIDVRLKGWRIDAGESRFRRIVILEDGGMLFGIRGWWWRYRRPGRFSYTTPAGRPSIKQLAQVMKLLG